MRDAYINEFMDILNKTQFSMEDGNVTDCYEDGIQQLLDLLLSIKKEMESLYLLEMAVVLPLQII